MWGPPASLVPLQFWEESSAQGYAFQIHTNQSRAHTPSYLPSQAPTLRATVLLPQSPQGQVPDSERWLKLFTPAKPEPAYPALPVPPWENPSKGSCPQSPASCLLRGPGASRCNPCDVWHMPLWGSTTITNHLFDASLIYWPYYAPEILLKTIF